MDEYSTIYHTNMDEYSTIYYTNMDEYTVIAGLTRSYKYTFRGTYSNESDFCIMTTFSSPGSAFAVCR